MKNNIKENQLTGKSYNPFKMWGSWVGFILYSISTANIWMGIGKIPIFNTIVRYSLYPFYLLIEAIELIPLGERLRIGIELFASIIITSIGGFLIGWGIHSLIRRFKK